MVDLLCHRSEELTNKVAYTYLINGEKAHELTYGELDRKARIVAAKLKSKSLVPGDRVLLVYPPGLDFIVSFFGCLYAGVIAVPSVPPNKHLQRTYSIIKDAKPVLGLTTNKLLQGMMVRFPDDELFRHFEWFSTDTIPEDSPELQWTEMESINREAIAFLQYTSGSTGTPKGVMVTHSNLLHNSQMLQSASQNNLDSVIVNWLPLYHDMGIIGCILQPLFVGGTCITMSPLDFLQKPLRWLKTISDYGGTYSGAPDFGYHLCTQKIKEEQLIDLDLSTWKTAFNGSDQVRHSTIEAFNEKFSRCGFERTSFYPSFGLAEATLMVTGGKTGEVPNYFSLPEKGNENTLEKPAPLVSLGTPWLGQTVKVVEPETSHELDEGEVGEVWVAGDSVTKGYWNNPEETKKTFAAYTSTGEGPFLRTGDLGLLHNKELYFKGRIKDLIIFRGKNHYPQDIELSAENSYPGFVPNSCAAFTVEKDEEERLILVAEVDRKISYSDTSSDFKKQLLKKVRKAITEHHDIMLHELVLVKQGTIAKTSSGKIQRNECKNHYLQNQLQLF